MWNTMVFLSNFWGIIFLKTYLTKTDRSAQNPVGHLRFGKQYGVADGERSPPGSTLHYCFWFTFEWSHSIFLSLISYYKANCIQRLVYIFETCCWTRIEIASTLKIFHKSINLVLSDLFIFSIPIKIRYSPNTLLRIYSLQILIAHIKTLRSGPNDWVKRF